MQIFLFSNVLPFFLGLSTLSTSSTQFFIFFSASKKKTKIANYKKMTKANYALYFSKNR